MASSLCRAHFWHSPSQASYPGHLTLPGTGFFDSVSSNRTGISLSKALLNALIPVLGIKWTLIVAKYDVFCASVLEIWVGMPGKVSLCLRNSSTTGRCVNVKLYSNLEVRFEANSGLHWQPDLVVKTLCFQYRRQRFDLWSVNWDPTYCAVQPKEKKKKNNLNLLGND